MSAYVLGARMALERLNSRTLISLSALLVGFTALVAQLERGRVMGAAVEPTLTGAVFGIAIPLFAYFAFEAALGRGAWSPALAPLSRHGAPRPVLALGMTLGLGCVTAVGSSLLGLLAVVLSRGFSDPALGRDLASVVWIAALTAAAYCGLFAFGSTVRRGRTWLLILDWILGSGSGFLALPWPRGHARNLLGYLAVMHMDQASAIMVLAAIAAGGVLMGTRRLAR